jgi:hypothetical protein
MRNNIKYCAPGKIIYCAAALGIILDINNNEQK